MLNNYSFFEKNNLNENPNIKEPKNIFNNAGNELPIQPKSIADKLSNIIKKTPNLLIYLTLLRK
jgi:hypothetical protein